MCLIILSRLCLPRSLERRKTVRKEGKQPKDLEARAARNRYGVFESGHSLEDALFPPASSSALERLLEQA